MKNKLQILSSAGFIAGLALLLLNDFVFKSLFHNGVTGKLSDFAGLFTFPLFWSAFFPKHKLKIFIFTAVTFAFWKSALSQPLINLWNSTGIFTLYRVVDYTDLAALIMLPFAYHYYKKQPVAWRLSPLIPLFLSVIAFVATSRGSNTNFEEGEAVYHIRHQSREGLVQDLKNSGLEVQFNNHNGATYPDEHVEVYNLNDSIADLVISIGGYNPANKTVELSLGSWSYVHSGRRGLSDRELKIQKRYVKALFEEKVLATLPEVK